MFQRQFLAFISSPVINIINMEKAPAARAGARAASTFIYDKAFVNGQWVAAGSGKTFNGKYTHFNIPLGCGIKCIYFKHSNFYNCMNLL